VRSIATACQARFDLPAFADATTKAMVAGLTVLAVVVVVVGLAKAVYQRRRQQLVITDIAALGAAAGGPQADAVNLSPWLRQRVRYALVEQRRDVDWILGENLLGRDIELGRLPVRLARQEIADQITSATVDALATVTSGLKAVAPKEAEGLLGALASALPAARGYLVHTMSVGRQHPDGTQLGLAIEVHRFDGTPIASTLLWDWSDTDLEPHRRIPILVDAAAEWVAARLVAFQLTARSARGRGRQLPEGVQRLVSGALTLNTMQAYQQFAIGFGEEADADLRAAEEVLPGYHRPAAIRAAVREHVGFAHRRAGTADLARTAFTDATTHWQSAIDLLAARPGAPPGDSRLVDELARLRLRKLKCLVLSERPGARANALAELRGEPLRTDYHPRTLYNAACLCALLLPEHLTDAWNMLGRALLASSGTNLWSWALEDPDLASLPGRLGFVEFLWNNRPANGSGIEEAIAAAQRHAASA
jgi:hypothetical protein